jgi:predicted Zn-dependent protease
MAANNIPEAIECFQAYTQYDKAGLEAYRTLAELYERRAKSWPHDQPAKKEQDIWVALHCTEHALSYDAKDHDLLARKDRYYYTVTPGEVKNRLESVYKWFDVDYCKQKVRGILDQGGSNPDLLDWAEHLANLAQTVDKDSLSARLLRARIKRQRGEIEETRALLEEVRQSKPEKFPSSEEEEAWFVANRLLGEMYVDDKPDQAVLCLSEYKKHPKSGANTLYHLGRAYENLGDRGRAAKFYEMVTAYEGNPLVWEAQDALQRVRGGQTDVVS